MDQEDLLRVPVAYLKKRALARSRKSWKNNTPTFQTKATPIDWSSTMCVQSNTFTFSPIGLLNDAMNSMNFSESSSAAFRNVFTNETQRYGRSLLGKYMPLTRGADAILDCIETMIVFWLMMSRAKSLSDKYLAYVALAKMSNAPLSELGVGISTLMAAYDHFFPQDGELEVQAATLPIFDDIRSFLDKYEVIKTSPIFPKMYKFSMYCLSMSILAPLGITLDSRKFDAVAQEAIRKEYHMGL